MTTTDRQSSDDDLHAAPVPHHRGLLTGVVLCGLGILIGSIALVLCCYSFGADFSGEGWGDAASAQPQPRRISFVMSLGGFALSIPLFWIGFFRIVHPELSEPKT
tara:strand:+ start:43704 stop:44018 length:315 start_codon:yes stop_codon:yes gene_type:complete